MNLHALEQHVAAEGLYIAHTSSAFSIAINRLFSGFILLEQDCLPLSLQGALTPFEQSLAAEFGERRKKSFTASRIALKLLAYKMGLVEPDHLASRLETVNRMDRRPILPGAADCYFASVSHDKRFTFVVADKRPIGVDIEAILPKIVKASHIFMDKKEIATAGATTLDMTQAAAMVWTAKEAAAKVLNLRLIDAWRTVRLLKLGRMRSIFTYGADTLTTLHFFEWDRVVSIISIPPTNDDELLESQKIPFP